MTDIPVDVTGGRQISQFEVVLPPMTNQFGNLFGGIALQWMDRAAWICATRFVRRTMVTIASDRTIFKHPVRQGDLVELCARIAKIGRTSVTVDVTLYSENPITGHRQLATRSEFKMVAIDTKGRPTPVAKADQ